jgi:ribosome-binding protein aMBF1 (putative translation factor)
MVTGDLIREARLRAGLTQAELGQKLDSPQSVIARWEAGAVTPSLETVRRIVRACGLDLTFSLAARDDSTVHVITDNLRMSPEQRFAALMARTSFRERRVRLEADRAE